MLAEQIHLNSANPGTTCIGLASHAIIGSKIQNSTQVTGCGDNGGDNAI
jgi:hypothetical protein